MRLRRVLVPRRYVAPGALAAASILAFACSSSSDSGCSSTGGVTDPGPLPTVPLAPRYVLDRVNGAAIPVTVRQTGTVVERVVADTIVFDAATPTASSGSYVEITVIETRDGSGAPVVTRQQSAPGVRKFTRPSAGGEGITMTDFVGGTNPGGSVIAPTTSTPGVLSLSAPSGVWTYLAR